MMMTMMLDNNVGHLYIEASIGEGFKMPEFCGYKFLIF